MTNDLPPLPDLDTIKARLPKLTRRLVDAALTMEEVTPDRPEYMHALLCQLGLPRSKQQERVFYRSSGNASLMLEAGKLATGLGRWDDMPLPYGAKPRLVLYHLCSEAVRTQSPIIDVGGSIRGFLGRVGIGWGGGELAEFKRQMTALACCRMTLAFLDPVSRRLSQTQAAPIKSFEAWLHANENQGAFWTDEIHLDRDFYDTLCAHAVPLDPLAIGALKHSALALDFYTWLAHRLCRVRTDNGVKVSWANLREQFGQEYADPKDFKKKAKLALRSVLTAYGSARVSDETGGIRLYPSPPPVPKSQVLIDLGSRK